MVYIRNQSDIIRNKNSLWIDANAGSGKTFILVNRVLFLLASGIEPKNILCITFSNAAAREIKNRLEKELISWAKDEKLASKLEDILGYEPSDELVDKIRVLYLKLSDIKISTIHSICQEIISNFTQELGLSRGYKIVNNFNLDHIWTYLDHQEIIDLFIEYIGDASKVEYEFNQMINNRKSVVLTKNFGDLLLKLGLLDHLSEPLKKLLLPVMESSLIDGVKFICSLIESKNNLEFSDLDVIANSVSDKYLIKSIEDYKNNPTVDNYRMIFFTQAGKLRNDIANFSNKHYLYDKIFDEVRYISDTLVLLNQIKLSAVYNITFIVVNEAYSRYKLANNIIDYNDMIYMANSLFNQVDNHDYIYNQLGYSFQYTLIDEAQDTNSLQWELIRKITRNFSSNMMVVGDKKQSIYYFQGTEPGIFDSKKDLIKSVMPLEEFSLNQSFRTNGLILKFVDTFLKGIGYKNIVHKSSRENDPGQIDFINITKSDYQPYLEDVIVDVVTEKVKNILSSRVILPSKNRVVKPEDIIVLLRKTTNNIDQKIAKKLKEKYGINASSKKSLSNMLIINDLLILGKFVFNPEDDLNLATILKGPLFNLNDEDLISICLNRNVCLWEQIVSYYPDYAAKLRKIIDLNKKIGYKIGPYQFFSSIWSMFMEDFASNSKCDCKLSNQNLDIINSFFDVCLQFEDNFPNLELNEFVDNFAIYSENIELQPEEGTVQIMTIHKSKGLQAPVVILGDFFRINDLSVKHNYYFINKAGLFLHKCYNKNSLLVEHNNIELDESDRLLYVGMTRAKDFLVLINIEDDIEKTNKYARLMKNIISYQKNSQNSFIKFLDAKKGSLFFQGYRLGSLDKSEEQLTPENVPVVFEEANNLKLLNKNPFPAVNEAMIKPISYGAIFGSIVHKVFEMYPFEGIDRQIVIKKLLEENFGHSRDLFKIEGIIGRLEKNNPKFADIIAKSRSEVLISGYINGEKKICRIDKLYIDDNKIIIIDFKTDNVLIEGKEDILNQYINQVNEYKLIVQNIYPSAEIDALLFFVCDCLVYKVN